MEQILIIKLVYVFNLKTTIYIIISFKHGTNINNQISICIQPKNYNLYHHILQTWNKY